MAAVAVPLSRSELFSLQSPSGALTDEALRRLRQHSFNRGLATDARREAWPLLLGVYPPTSTRAEHDDLAAAQLQEYKGLVERGAALALDPAFKDGSVVAHDVNRTQVSHPLYAEHKQNLSDILLAYAAYEPEVGYGQGMSDMLAVLLFTLGEPSLAFWCFAALLGDACPAGLGSGTTSAAGAGGAGGPPSGLRGGDARRLHLASAITDTADGVLGRLMLILQRRAPALHVHFMATGCEGLLFCYAWVKMLLKRELPFEEVGRLWEGCWGAHAVLPNAATADDILLYCCAVILVRRQKQLLKVKDGMAGVMNCLKEGGGAGVEPLEHSAHELLHAAAEMARAEKFEPGGGE